MVKQGIFTVIAGDLIKSSEIVDRQAVSRHIDGILEEVAVEYRRFLYAPLIMTKGMDEISGILTNPGPAQQICRRLNYALFPNCFRFAIVRNSLDVNVDSGDASKIDGPAFHLAAELIEGLKKENLFYAFRLNAEQPFLDDLLGSMANLVTLIANKRSRRQDTILREYMKLERQKDVASKLRISQQAVSDSLKGFHWNYIKKVELQIDSVLKNLL